MLRALRNMQKEIIFLQGSWILGRGHNFSQHQRASESLFPEPLHSVIDRTALHRQQRNLRPVPGSEVHIHRQLFTERRHQFDGSGFGRK